MNYVLRSVGLILLIHLCATSSYAQKDILDSKVNVSITEGTLREIFENLEASNRIIVSYSSSIVDISIEKQLDTTTYVASRLFSYLLQEQSVRAISRGRKILIIPDPSKNTTFSALKPRNYYTINGYVKDAETGEALIGASVYNPLTRRGTTTNEFGYYSFTMPEGSQTVNYSFVGFNSMSKTFKLGKRIRSDIYLTSNIEIEEILVIDQDSSAIWRGREKIDIERIRNIPAVFGEVDVIKSISLLPGIQSGNEAQGALLVRGGSPDQNLIMVDGMPLYEVNHLLGLVSIFNEDVINNVNLYKGDFSAKYGGRLSSVVDIQLKDGNYKEFHGSATAGFLGGKFNLEGPIQKEKSSFNIAGRTSWIDRLVSPALKNYRNIEGTRFNYSDFNLKIKREFKSTNSLTFSAYYGNDVIKYNDLPQNVGDFNLKTQNNLSWSNKVASLRWSRLLGSKMFTNLTIGFVDYDYLYHVRHSLEDHPDPDIKDEVLTVASTSRILDRIAKIDVDYFVSNRIDVKFGAGYVLHTFNPSIRQASRKFENDIDDIFGGIIPTNAAEYSLYAENYFRPLSNISIHTGAHAAIYNVEGKRYYALQPRISANYGLPWNAYFGLSYSRMNQFVHLLGNPGLGLPIDLWVPSTENLAPESSDQFAASYSMDIFKNVKMTTGVYFKTFENLIEFQSAYDLFSPVINQLDSIPVFSTSTNWESRVTSGDGRAYGFEFQLAKKRGRTTGSFSYTYGRSFRLFQDINRAIPFPYRYDRRHDISLSMVHNINPNWNLGLLWVYGSGNAVTLPIEQYFSINGDVILNYEARNNQRLPDYHRFDFSLNYDKYINRFGLRVTFGAYNTYNRQNAYYLYLYQNPKNEQYSLRQVSVFPIIPYLNVKLKI